MKIVLCNSGHIRTMQQVLNNQNDFLIEFNNCDVFVYTSDLCTQRRCSDFYVEPSSEVFYNKKYPKGEGLICKIDKKDIIYKLQKAYGRRLKNFFIESEVINDPKKEQNPKKWEFHRVRQFYKIYQCNKMVHEYEKNNNIKYDIIVRNRLDTKFLRHKINIEQLVNDYKGNLNKAVFIFGGWPDHKGISKSRIGFSDVFAFGVPKVMDIYADVHFLKKIYENGGSKIDKENPGNQLEQYLLESGLEIVYIHGKTPKSIRGYQTIR